MTNEEKAKYDAYRDVYAFLHYHYKYGKKSKDQIVEDIKHYCFEKSEELFKKE